MENIIWLVDANTPLEHASIDKVISLARAFDKNIDLVIDKRQRFVERSYWLHIPALKKVSNDLAMHQDTLTERLSAQLENNNIRYSVHNSHTGDYLASLNRLVIENTLLIVRADTGILRHPVFLLAKEYNCNILLLGDKPWSLPFKIAAAVDPLHENDRPAILDHYIVKLCRSLKKNMQGKLQVIHCCFISPLFLQHKEAILDIHRESVRKFAKELDISTTDIKILQGNPEHIIPNWIERNSIDILCLGYIARNSLENYLIGSTTHALLKAPPCDMLMVHQNDS